MTKTVTVFGSSKPLPGEKEYEIAYQLGRKLGASGLNVCTGGYQGIMDAVTKGASESNSEAIGVTVKYFKAIPSPYLTKEIKCNTLFERLETLIYTGDAYIILDGGTGTLLELAAVWELVNKGQLQNKPAASHGKIWKKIIDVMDRRMLMESRQTGVIKNFSDINSCGDYIISELK